MTFNIDPNASTCRPWLNFSLLLKSYQAVYQVHRWAFRTHLRIHIVQGLWNYVIMWHPWEGEEKKKEEKKRQGLSDSLLTLMDRRHYRHSYLVQNLKRKCQEEREGKKSEIHYNIITLRRVILAHPDIVQMQKLGMLLLHLSFQEQFAHWFCIQNSHGWHWKF